MRISVHMDSTKKKQKQAKGAPGKHLQARISYLHRAATYLSTWHALNPVMPGQAHLEEEGEDLTMDSKPSAGNLEPLNIGDTANQTRIIESLQHPPSSSSKDTPLLGIQRLLVSHLRAVSLKGQIRLSREVKRSLCKKCNTLLVPDTTSNSFTENKSRGGEKPWANVLVIECKFCGMQKRFPVGAKRQSTKDQRPEKPPPKPVNPGEISRA